MLNCWVVAGSIVGNKKCPTPACTIISVAFVKKIAMKKQCIARVKNSVIDMKLLQDFSHSISIGPSLTTNATMIKTSKMIGPTNHLLVETCHIGGTHKCVAPNRRACIHTYTYLHAYIHTRYVHTYIQQSNATVRIAKLLPQTIPLL